MTLEYAGLLNFVRICVHGGRILHALLRIFVYSAEHMRPPTPCTNQAIWPDDAGMHGEDGRRKALLRYSAAAQWSALPTDGPAGILQNNNSETISSKKNSHKQLHHNFM